MNSQKVKDNKSFKRLNLNYRNASLKLGFISEIYHTKAVFFLIFQCDLCCKECLKKTEENL